MGLGEVFTGTFRILRQQPKLFASISALMMLAPMVFFGGYLVMVYSLVAVLVRGSVSGTLTPGSLAPSLWAGLAIVVGSILVVLVNAKFQSMLIVAADDIARGNAPTLGTVWTSSQGFIRRLLPIWLIMTAAIVVVGLVTGFVTYAIVAASMSSTSGRSSSGAAGAVVQAISTLIVLPLTFWLSTKLLYLYPAAAIERRPGMDAAKRSWTLTKGAFWRTFGYHYVGQLPVGMVATGVIYAAMMLMILSVATAAQRGDINAMMGGLAISFVVFFIVLFVIQFLSVAYTMVFPTVMYIDQVRRIENPQPAWAPQAAYQAPQQYYAPQQPYPPQQGYAPPQYPPPAPQATQYQAPPAPQYPPVAPQAPQPTWAPPAASDPTLPAPPSAHPDATNQNGPTT